MQSIIHKITSLKQHCENNYHVQIPTTKIQFTPNYPPNGTSTENRIVFVQADTLITAMQYTHPLVLIFADDVTPGGTWISNCQEEVLFRRSALCAHLRPTMYPIHTGELLFARDVAIFNTNPYDYTQINYNEPIRSLDFVAIPCVRNYNGEYEVYIVLRDKIRFIYQTCIQYSYTTIILGAFGCGAYGCNAKQTARVFKEVQHEFSNHNLTIVYAILGTMYHVFYEEIM